jgi:hypothetical protein
MIRVLLAPGSAAAANGITANVNVSLDAKGAGSDGADLAVNLTLDKGSAVGDVLSSGLDESVVFNIYAGLVTAGAVLDGSDLTTSLALTAGGAPATGVDSTVTVSLNPGDAEGGVVLPEIGDAFQGGFYAGLISHTADGVATHALIVAPRATGASGGGYPISTNLRLKTSRTSTSNTNSYFDGAANTAAMVTAGISAHPAAQFCVGLNIGGFTDWYLPAPAELAIAYTNLKPTATNNQTSVGINDYAVPARVSNYTVGDPAQTSLTAFQTGGSEVFEIGDVHWSSAEIGAQTQTTVFFSNGFIGQGWSNVSVKDITSFRTRAFRKIPL